MKRPTFLAQIGHFLHPYTIIIGLSFMASYSTVWAWTIITSWSREWTPVTSNFNHYGEGNLELALTYLSTYFILYVILTLFLDPTTPLRPRKPQESQNKKE